MAKAPTKSDRYREILPTLADWIPYLLQESGLPGPRGNLELAQVVADLGNAALFESLLRYDAQAAPVNSPQEFLAFCGAVGLGRLAAEGDLSHLPTLRSCASDPRWRMREGVAMALQRLGDVNMPLLLNEMKAWAKGNSLEKRAAAAALCEPRLLKKQDQAEAVLEILDDITASIHRVKNRKDEGFIALRKGLGYCWSVAVAAHPQAGKPLLQKWLADQDADITWIMRENLKKNRLRFLGDLAI
jgi:hypothetical protein